MVIVSMVSHLQTTHKILVTCRLRICLAMTRDNTKNLLGASLSYIFSSHSLQMGDLLLILLLEGCVTMDLLSWTLLLIYEQGPKLPVHNKHHPWPWSKKYLKPSQSPFGRPLTNIAIIVYCIRIINSAHSKLYRFQTSIINFSYKHLSPKIIKKGSLGNWGIIYAGKTTQLPFYFFVSLLLVRKKEYSRMYPNK